MKTPYDTHQKKFLKALGDRIKTFRQAKDISQERLAILAGIDRSYIGKVERGEKNISILKLVLIAEVLKISIGDLFAEIDKR